jgi:hypothetical protein
VGSVSSDQQAEAIRFIVFMLETLRDTRAQLAGADQVNNHVTGQVKSFLRILSVSDMIYPEP